MNQPKSQWEFNGYAGFWIRLASLSLDSILFWILILSVLLPLSHYLDFNLRGILITLAGMQTHPEYNAAYLIYNMIGVLPVLWLWSKFSATPGKMIFRIRIVDEQTHSRPSNKQILLRAMGYFVSTIVFCLGFLWIFIDKEKRGWHDMIAKTRVIKIK